MKLIVVSSNSSGNSYALQADTGEILLLEAGVPLKEVKKAIGYQTSKIVGCVTSHAHQDHAKCIPEYIKAGITVSSNDEVAAKYLGVDTMLEGTTYGFGGFRVAPFLVEHDAKNFGYIIFHPECKSIFFATDCYNLKQKIRGCKTYLMECNYKDSLLQKAVDEGKTPASQADRIRLSHMSLAHAVEFLQQCEAEKTARQVVLIHGSSRHLNPGTVVVKFQQVLGVPTYYARPNLILNLM